MRKQERKANTSGMLALLLFLVFTVCILSLLMTGADTYQRLSQRDQDSYDRRTATQYVTTKVRQFDVSGEVFVGAFNTGVPDAQGDTLYLKEAYDGEAYYTRIYCHDGSIRELFAEQTGSFLPEDGEIIMKCQSLQFFLEDHLLTVEIGHETGETEQFILYLRSEEVAS